MQVAEESREEIKELERGRPADYSFKKIKILKAVGLEEARSSRVGPVPERGNQNKKFLTKSIWVNNNRLKTIKNVETFVDSILEFPEFLGWLDFSFNNITDIDPAILKFPNLKIVYFHGNCIENIDEVIKLRHLKQLRTVTLHGNPISNQYQYRSCVIAALPQILNLDFTPILKTEKMSPPPADFARKLMKKKQIETCPNY